MGSIAPHRDRPAHHPTLPLTVRGRSILLPHKRPAAPNFQKRVFVYSPLPWYLSSSKPSDPKGCALAHHHPTRPRPPKHRAPSLTRDAGWLTQLPSAVPGRGDSRHAVPPQPAPALPPPKAFQSLCSWARGAVSFSQQGWRPSLPRVRAQLSPSCPGGSRGMPTADERTPPH